MEQNERKKKKYIHKFENTIEKYKLIENKYLSGSTALMSAVLVGFVLVSKLNAFGLSECGDAVVELANHNFESVVGFDKPPAFAEELVEPPALDAIAPDNALFVPDILRSETEWTCDSSVSTNIYSSVCFFMFRMNFTIVHIKNVFEEENVNGATELHVRE